MLFQEEDEQKMQIMRKAFQMFDTSKTGLIDTIKISTILNTMGQIFDDGELTALIEECDPEGKSSSCFFRHHKNRTPYYTLNFPRNIY